MGDELAEARAAAAQASDAAAAAKAQKKAKRAEVGQLQRDLNTAAQEVRELSITLFLTGCKPDEVKPQEGAAPGSLAETVNSLLAAKNPRTNEPYITLKAGRPAWDDEFQLVRQAHRREKIGCVFCGAPAIAAALKAACETHSDVAEGTIFKLHKENF